MQKSKILIFFLFALAFSCSAQNKTIAGQHPVTHVGLMEPILTTKDIAPPPLTIEDVKNCIAFPKGEWLHTTLCKMVDVWYAIEKKSGRTDEQAALIALDKLGEQLLKFSKPATNEKK